MSRSRIACASVVDRSGDGRGRGRDVPCGLVEQPVLYGDAPESEKRREREADHENNKEGLLLAVAHLVDRVSDEERADGEREEGEQRDEDKRISGPSSRRRVFHGGTRSGRVPVNPHRGALTSKA